MGTQNLAVNGNRLWQSLMDMAKIGATEKGGVCRLALTDLDRQSRNLFIDWCEDAGCSIRIDRMGNIFARREGAGGKDLSPVMTGSHLDTQPTGGRFDGVYGVLSGLEVLRTLNEFDITTERPIEVVVWTNEEGSRFAPAMVASGVFSGSFSLEYGLSRADSEGKTIGTELERIGFAGDEQVGGFDIHAFFETHIEQGPILEDEEKTIGIVTHAQGQRWYEVEMKGVESHAGPTPMPVRKDALVGAAKVVELVNKIGHKFAPDACATVGMMNVLPNSRNVIPGHVFLTIDIRNPDDQALANMDNTLRQGIEAIAKEGGLDYALDQIFSYDAIAFADDCVAAVEKGAEKFGYSSRKIVSGAGHDACYISKIAPTSMVFVPCIGGISHNEIEDALPEWITAGANVLLSAIVEKAGAGTDV